MLRQLTAACAASALLLLAAPAGAADQLWKIDPAHADVEFGIKHFALSTVKGTIPVQAGAIAIPAGKDIPTSIEVTLNAAGIDTKDDRRNDDLKSASWFEVAKYPTMTFKSTKITGTDPANFVVDGDLTMHGVTKPVELQAHLEGRGQGGRGDKRVAYSATTTIHRQDFNLIDSHTNAMGALLVANDAAISLQVEAVGQP